MLMLLAPATIGSEAAAHPGHGPPTVSVVNFSYNPTPLHIYAGDSVIWIWNGSGADLDHSVTSDPGQPVQFDSDPGKSPAEVHHQYNDGFSFQFNTPGTYTYYCKVHAFMHGTVVVHDVSASGATGPASAGSASTRPQPGPPVVSGVAIAPARLCDRRSRSCSARAGRGTTLSITLDRTATVIAEFHLLHGAHLSHKVAKEIDLPGLAGPNRLQIDPGRLRPGRYGLLIRAISTGGESTAPQRFDVSIRR